MGDIVTQKEFYETIQKLEQEIHKVTNTMTETQTLIRDYNGLRGKINDFDNRLQTLEDNHKNKKNYREYIAWLVALANTLLAVFMTIR